MYVDDTNVPWALLVDGDYFLDIERNWQSAAGLGLSPFPRGWRPRRVKGVDSTGRIRYAIVPDVSSPLWTGEVSTFQFETRDGGVEVATVIELHQERRFLAPPA